MWPPPDPHRGRRGRGRGDAVSFALLLSLWQQARGLEGQPPVTLALAALQVALHFRGLLLPELASALPQSALIHAACLSPARVLRAGEWWRLLTAVLVHADDLHVYYNTASFLAKGAQLEPRLGSRAYARLLARLALGSTLLHVALATALARLSPATFGHEARLAAAGTLGASEAARCCTPARRSRRRGGARRCTRAPSASAASSSASKPC